MLLYSENLVDIVFGEGPLGFRIGETNTGKVIISDFSKKEKDEYYPIQAIGTIDKGWFIISINTQDVSHKSKKEIKEMLHNIKRPITVRFAKPIVKSAGSFFADFGLVTDHSWTDKDSYLPVRKYDFTNMPADASYICRSNFSPYKLALTPICEHSELFICDIRDYCYNGTSDARTRSLIWKMLLSAYSKDPCKWESSRQKNLTTYNAFVEEFITSPNRKIGKLDCEFVPSPIDYSWKHDAAVDTKDNESGTNESKWSRDFPDTALREIIWKDVERTYGGEVFFAKYNKQVLSRLLYIFSKLNKGVEYVQGMNELLAPLLYAFAEYDHQKEVSRTVEADTFFAFTNLMTETMDLFLRQMDSCSSGMFHFTLLITFSEGVIIDLKGYIDRHAPKASHRLDELGIATQYFAIRWMMTMFAREFPIDKTLRVWDSLLADPQRFMLLYCLGTALVKLVEDQLMEGDFTDCILLLQNYLMPEEEIALDFANRIRIRELKLTSGVKEEAHNNLWDTVRTKGGPIFSRFLNKSTEVASSVGKSVQAGVSAFQTSLAEASEEYDKMMAEQNQ